MSKLILVEHNAFVRTYMGRGEVKITRAQFQKAR